LLQETLLTFFIHNFRNFDVLRKSSERIETKT